MLGAILIGLVIFASGALIALRTWQGVRKGSMPYMFRRIPRIANPGLFDSMAVVRGLVSIGWMGMGLLIVWSALHGH